jgi:hypothetical protein
LLHGILVAWWKRASDGSEMAMRLEAERQREAAREKEKYAKRTRMASLARVGRSKKRLVRMGRGGGMRVPPRSSRERGRKCCT